MHAWLYDSVRSIAQYTSKVRSDNLFPSCYFPWSHTLYIFWIETSITTFSSKTLFCTRLQFFSRGPRESPTVSGFNFFAMQYIYIAVTDEVHHIVLVVFLLSNFSPC